MIPILLDPWLLKCSPSATDPEAIARSTSLRNIFQNLRGLYPLRVLPFITQDELAAFYQTMQHYKGADAMDVTRYIAQLLEIVVPTVNTAVISDKPCPDDLSSLWLKVLSSSGNTDNPPRWRYPMVVIPEARRGAWPKGDEIIFSHEGFTRSRNLVNIDDLLGHKFFERDIDPWRLKCVGEPRPADPLNEKTVTCKRLPRPPQISNNMPLAQLTQRLREIADWTCGTSDSFFYIPPPIWNPIAEEKEKWRNGEMFPEGIVHKEFGKKESGFLDINGNVWVWDLGEKDHWDVKTTDDLRVARVLYTGRKRPC